MSHKLLTTLSAFIVTFITLTSNVWATVNVNTADEAMLISVKGIGSAKAKAIITERTKNGPYQNAADLASRVKGLSGKSIEKLQKEGLTVDQAAATAASGIHGKQGKLPAPKKK